ncbi:alpha-1,3-arabinosyltransferase XAT3-like [Typha angustifolia]|uniref:alpha-1,3-arabinosyltransferase XAT3-like n=1 Tax=Typha angustifolia TaxID=59011 RepID=UPI003C2E0341
MAYDGKLVRSFSRMDPQKFWLWLVAGCLLITVAIFSMSKFDEIHAAILNSPPSSSSTDVASSNHLVEANDSSEQPDMEQKNATLESNVRCEDEEQRSLVCKGKDEIATNGSTSSIVSDSPSVSKDSLNGTQQLDSLDELQEVGTTSEQNLGLLENATIVENNSFQRTITTDDKQQDGKREDVKLKWKPMCDVSNRRSDLCEIEGDVRILGSNSTIILVTSPEMDGLDRNEVWRIKPYPRKPDKAAMAHVREVTLKTMNNYAEAPQCTDNHDVPAIVFSDRGYTGNYFHDFTDVLVPIFETSYQFDGEVLFLITDFKLWWIGKYLPVFKNLSRYELIDIDNDNRVHCFRHAIIGLKSHDDFTIDPYRSRNDYSMVDFTKFMRRTYSLKRDYVMTIDAKTDRKPRLLIVARERTRKFVNIKKIISMATKLGYEVVVSEGHTDVAQFSQVVNSCDIMMGVHGAGLTNIVFLPVNAILIQIVPWGGLDWVARTYFRQPAMEMNLRYMEYKIMAEESTLIDQYPRDHAVFKDPESIRRLGWNSLKEVFLDKQDVKLNLKRFKPVLLKALKLLYSK